MTTRGRADSPRSSEAPRIVFDTHLMVSPLVFRGATTALVTEDGDLLALAGPVAYRVMRPGAFVDSISASPP